MTANKTATFATVRASLYTEMRTCLDLANPLDTDWDDYREKTRRAFVLARIISALDHIAQGEPEHAAAELAELSRAV